LNLDGASATSSSSRPSIAAVGGGRGATPELTSAANALAESSKGDTKNFGGAALGFR
jgi:hypothetical protein